VGGINFLYASNGTEGCQNQSHKHVGSMFTGPLNMARLQVEKDLSMYYAELNNRVALNGAEIGGQLNMSGSKFAGFLDMNGLRVEKDFSMHNAKLGKDVRLVLSNPNGGRDLSRSTFASFDLTGTHIRGQLALNGTSWTEGTQLILVDTDVGILHYTEEAWPEKLDLSGFTYPRLKSETTIDVSWFKRWLERQEQYAPQPYEQLASVLLKQGYESEWGILYASRERT
jgi:hypothetical protein